MKISFSQFVSFLSFPLPVLRTQKRDDEIHVKMQEEYKRAQEVERVKENQRWEESVRYQEQLEKQLAEKERRKQEAYEEFLKEKLMIDEIVRKIYEEDQRCVARCSLLGVKFGYLALPIIALFDRVSQYQTKVITTGNQEIGKYL